MHIIDLSQPMYDGAPNCPGHPPVRMTVAADHPEAGWRLEVLEAATHTGSHLDAPFHRLADGRTLDAFPLEAFAAVPAYIADLRGAVGAGDTIGPDLLAPRLPDRPLNGAAVLLATGWGDRRAKTDEWLYRSPYLSPEGAAYLVGRGAVGVGIDHYSVGGSGGEVNERTHEALLGAGLWILEELRFPEEAFALPQPASLWALPVNLGPGVSGSFCRPVLVVSG